MLTNLKALTVILPLAVATFMVAKPICLQFMAKEDFQRRRNIWIALTTIAFLAPSVWIFVGSAVLLAGWAGRKDPTPLALYVFLVNIVPSVLTVELPIVGINALFRLDGPRVFALAILVPVVWRMAQDRNNAGAFRLTALDSLILCYGALTVVQMLPHESPTHSARRAFLFLIDIALPYFVASRACTDRRAIVDVLASFCLACALLTPPALFEMVGGWLLYAGIGDHWGIPRSLGYETRGGFLRAQASSGHSLALGNLLAIGFGFWLYLRAHGAVRKPSAVVIVWLWLGLIAAASRGPWLAALTALFVYIAVGPAGIARLFKAFFIAIPVAGAVLLSPIGSHIIDRLPFVGTIGAENVAYRQLILAVSWGLIKESPFFGNPMVISRLEVLRQGEGIIDMVNGYVTIALFHGLVGLGLWLGFVLGCIWKAFQATKLNAERDKDLSLLGAALIGCIFAFLSMTGTGGVGPTVEKILFVVAGLALSYAALHKRVQVSQQNIVVNNPYRQSRS